MTERGTQHDSKKRILTAVTMFMIVFVVIYASFYIAYETEHECTGDDCPICCQIEIYESALKNIASAVVAAAAAVVFGYGSCVQVVRSAEIISARTLVSLRVKLSN